MSQMQDPWFDPNSPGATWGRGASSVMQGLYGQMMYQKQVDEAKRQFDATHGLDTRKQDWEETNTPAYNFGQMTDVTREKFGQDIPMAEVQENFLGQHSPKYEQTIGEKVREAVESGAFPNPREAYEYFGKVGSYDPYQVRVQGGYGQRTPSEGLQRWNDTLGMWEQGYFGDPKDPASQERMLQYWNQSGLKQTQSLTARPRAKEQALISQQTSTRLGSRLSEIKKNLEAIEGKYAESEAPKKADTERVPGVLGLGGIFSKKAPEWEPYHREQHDRYEAEEQATEAAKDFIDYVSALASSGTELPDSVDVWLRRLLTNPDVINDPTFIEQIPLLTQEIQGGGQQEAPQGNPLAQGFSLSR